MRRKLQMIVPLSRSDKIRESLSKLESRGRSQHNELLSKIIEHRSKIDRISRKMEETRGEAKQFRQESKNDFSALADDVRSKFSDITTASSSASAKLDNIDATLSSTQTTVTNVAKNLNTISRAMTSAQITLISLRDTGLQVRQFLRTFPTELRGLLQSILRTNMHMYFMLLNIQSHVSTSPSLSLQSNIKFEDALGVVRELPYEWFRHWEVCSILSYSPIEAVLTRIASLSKVSFEHNSEIVQDG
jgi:hypothetical protein